MQFLALLFNGSQLGFQLQAGVQQFLIFSLLAVGLFLVRIGQAFGGVEFGLRRDGQLFTPLAQEHVNVLVKLRGLGGKFLVLAAQHARLAAHRGRGVFQLIQVVFNLADVLIEHGDGIGLQRLVYHVMQIGRNQSANFLD